MFAWHVAQASDGVLPAPWQAAQPGGLAHALWIVATLVLWHPAL
jgi:hypothetical protein